MRSSNYRLPATVHRLMWHSGGSPFSSPALCSLLTLTNVFSIEPNCSSFLVWH